jgi:spore maturation protein SpmA
LLNYIWGGFFLIGAVVALLRFLSGDATIFQSLVQSTFDSAKMSAEIALGLVGVLALWSGFFRIAEQAGLIATLGRWLSPLFSRLMPEVPQGHPAQGAVTMNLAANMLGLDNAATPLGLKAMQELQSLNPSRDTASNAQILFLVLNTSSVTLLPVTIFLYRAQMGAADPTLVFIPILLATMASSLAGLVAVMLIQKIRLDGVLLAWFGGFFLLMATALYWLSVLPGGQLSTVSSALANGTLLLVILGFILAGWRRRVPVYEQFVEGAKEGFETAVRLIPYLVAMLVAIGVFRASGALDYVAQGMKALCDWSGWDNRFVDALPVALMKPFSGGGARAMLLDVMGTHGVDSFAGRLAAVMQGSTETTFYVLAVYFGVVGITRIRYALWCGLLADGVGLTTAVAVSYWFFG